MRPQGGNAVVGAGSPGGERTDASESVMATELAPCEGACLATAIAAAGASAEPVPPSEGTPKNEAKAVSAAGKIAPRSGRQSTVVTAADARTTKRPSPADDADCEVTRMCDTGYPCQVCLLSRFSSLLACVGCVAIEDRSFIPFGTMRDGKGARCLALSPWFPSKIRLPSNTIRSQYLRSGDYRPFKAIQGNTIT